MNISPESIPKSVIDFASIADITGSDTLAMDLIDTFLVELKKTKQEFVIAATAYDIERLRALCHRLGGATAYFVTPQLNAKLQILHEQLRNEPQDHTEWLPAYDELIAAIDDLSNLCNH